MIKLIRTDERLIHGQCMNFIVKENGIKDIVVVDDVTANNALLSSIFHNAVPKEYTANVYTLEASLPVIKEAMNNNVSTLLLMKNPRTLVKLMEKIDGLPKSLNIGPQMARNGVKCVDFATLHQEDVEACKKLTENGVRVYFNAIGAGSSTTEWEKVANKII